MKPGPKLLLAPLLTALAALTAGALYGALNLHQTAEVRRQDAADAAAVAVVAQTHEQLARMRGDVFRTLALISSTDEDQVQAFRKQLAGEVQGLQKAVGELPSQMGQDAEIGRLSADLAPALAAYGARCDKAIDLSGMDPNIGVGAMRAAEDSYGQLAQGLAAVVARSQALHAERAQASDARARSTSLLLGLAVLGVTGAALWNAWRLQRRIVAELGGAVALSRAVAQGDLRPGPAARGDDEIAELQQALAQMVQGLSGTLETVRLAADHIGTASQEIASGNADLRG